MTTTTSLPLFHSWPAYEAPLRLPLGSLFGAQGDVELPARGIDSFAAQGVGIWHFDLRGTALNWTAPVYELFGLPLGEPLSRSLAASLYLPGSRAAMEELRAYAIRHCRGFTLDARIRRPDGDVRWMRLSATPVIQGRKVARLYGTKQDVTADYDGAG